MIYTATVTNIFDFLHDFLVSYYPDARSDCHGQLPRQGWAHSDVEVFEKSSEETDQEHNQVKEEESN